MKLLVCLKQIPDPRLVEFNVQKKELECSAWRLNPLDGVALEEALRLKDNPDVSVTVITVGPDRAGRILRQGLTSGADNAIRVWEPFLERTDAYVTAQVLAAAGSQLNADLILCGARSADGGGGCVGAYLAEELGIPYITRAVALTSRDGAVTAHSREESGWREELHAMLPAVVGVDTGLNEPRYVPLLSRAYKQGMNKPIEIWDVEKLGVKQDQLGCLVLAVEVMQPRPRTKVGTKVSGLSMAQKLKLMRGQAGGRQREVLTGAPSEVAPRILARLEEWLA